jgi:hypothetical protein
VTLFIVYLEPEEDAQARGAFGSDSFRLQRGLYLMQTPRTRSRVYHSIKRKLSPDAALLVAPLEQAPKFKKMSDGALKWVRSLAHE